MTQTSILILDDDEKWLALHERRLTQADLSYFATQEAGKAIDWGKSKEAIKFALIDEILYVPPIPLNEEEGELQRWQGSGVIREITNLRSDIQFIVVTSAPQKRSDGDNLLFSKETAKLRRQRGVIDVVHKHNIDMDPDAEYEWILELIERSSSPSTSDNIKPRVLVGLGFDKETFAAMQEQTGRKKSSRLPLSVMFKSYEVYDVSGKIKTIGNLLQRATEKRIFIEAPGSKKLDRTRISSTSQSFQILEFLATRSELGKDILIREKDYDYQPRQSSHDDIDTSVDPHSIQDFAFDYGEGKKQLRSGVQIESRKRSTSRLKTAIHRLKKSLATANVGAPKTLFTAEHGAYRPSFEIGIILYPIKAKSRRS